MHEPFWMNFQKFTFNKETSILKPNSRKNSMFSTFEQQTTIPFLKILESCRSTSNLHERLHICQEKRQASAYWITLREGKEVRELLFRSGLVTRPKAAGQKQASESSYDSIRQQIAFQWGQHQPHGSIIRCLNYCIHFPFRANSWRLHSTDASALDRKSVV